MEGVLVNYNYKSIIVYFVHCHVNWVSRFFNGCADRRGRTGRTWTDGTDVDGRGRMGRTWTEGTDETDVDGLGRTDFILEQTVLLKSLHNIGSIEIGR